jgi:hypothetical protein
MTINSFNQQNPDPILRDGSAGNSMHVGSAALKGESNPPSTHDGVNVIELAFYYLLEASTTACASAVIHSKLLEKNALSQIRMNNEFAQLQFYSVPELQIDHHVITIKHHHLTWKFWKHDDKGKGWKSMLNPFGMFSYVTIEKIDRPTIRNQGVIDQMGAKNQMIAGQRQTFADRLNVLQQLAQVGETNANNFSDEAMQTMQMGSSLLDILQNLTFQALLRHPTK